MAGTYLEIMGVRYGEAVQMGGMDVVLEISPMGEALPAEELHAVLTVGLIGHGNSGTAPQDTLVPLYDADGARVYDAAAAAVFVRAPGVSGFDPETLPYGTPIAWRGFGGELLGTYTLSAVERVGPHAVAITAQSPERSLSGRTARGGMYTGQPLPEVLHEIVGDAVRISVSSEYSYYPVYGWLPYRSPADGGALESLRQLLQASAATLRRCADGALLVAGLDMDPAELIPSARLGKAGRRGLPEGWSAVQLSTYAYEADMLQDPETLYRGAVPAAQLTSPGGAALNGYLLLFDRPVVPGSLSAQGCTVLEAHPNYAVLSGSPDAELLGIPYTSTQGTRLRQNPAAVGEVRIKGISGNTLITAATADSLLRRLGEYYFDSYAVSGQLLLRAERPGGRIQVVDSAGIPRVGWLTRVRLRPGARNILADYELRAGFSLSPPDVPLRCVDVIRESGDYVIPWVCDLPGALAAGAYTFAAAGQSWSFSATAVSGSGLRLVFDGTTVRVWSPDPAQFVASFPAAPGSGGTALSFSAVRAVRAVLIGGGVGGEAGQRGEDGQTPTHHDNTYTEDYHTIYYYDPDAEEQAASVGGDPGRGGSPGPVALQTLSVDSGDVLALTVGAAGVGGTAEVAATAGSPSTLEVGGVVYSSADGGALAAGYPCPLQGVLYAKAGAPGVKGAPGGRTSTTDLWGFCGTGCPGLRLDGSNGAAGGAALNPELGRLPTGTGYVAAGGGGGGDAYGASGSPGSDARTYLVDGYTFYYAEGGAGGGGANAAPPPDAEQPGDGGGGGNGGGGGGNGGGARVRRSGYFASKGAAGPGGAGSRGGNAASGAILLYF